jgi:carboxylesterase
MWPIVGHLSAADHTVFAPTLPGHGGRPDDLIRITWQDWLDAAAAWPADVVVGQSMGALLAAQLVAERRCGAAVLINPLAPDPDAIDGLEWRLSRGAEWVEVGKSTLGEESYDRLPLAALLAMHRGIAAIDLAAIERPLLIVTSLGDEVVDPSNSEVIASTVAGTVERLMLAKSGHVASLDTERDVLGRAIVEFVGRVA